jgi:8-oxo-dGTP pyrophosphatase MutT (NUDIX family)
MEPRKKIFTLILITRKNSREILLGFKKKKGLGQGKWNGFGGKVEPGETINQAAVR